MEDLEAELQAAIEEWNTTNPWKTKTGAMLPSILAQRRLEAARVACWEAGRCCGAGAGGLCPVLHVQWAREKKLVECGMGVRNAAALSKICDHSEQWLQIEAVRGVLADDTAVDVRTVIEAVLQSEEAGNV